MTPWVLCSYELLSPSGVRSIVRITAKSEAIATAWVKSKYPAYILGGPGVLEVDEVIYTI